MHWSPKRRLGNIGENVACVFLQKHGYELIERNYLRKWGEIDIVAKRDGVMHFVEVKSVSGVTPVVEQSSLRGRIKDTYRAEDNLHHHKLKRLQRVIQTYIMEKNLDCDWQLDLVVVKIDEKRGTATAQMLENVI